jgi:hypothetical protein
MGAMKFKEEFERIVRCLCGIDEENFEEERMLRLLQLQLWIYQDCDVEEGLADAAIVYASISLSMRLNTIEKRQRELSGAVDLFASISELCADPSARPLLNLLLSQTEKFYYLTKIPSLSHSRDSRSASLTHVKSLCAFLDLVLGLSYINKIKNPNTTAEQVHRYKASQIRKQPDKVRTNMVSGLDEIKRDRKERAAFLYVARKLRQPELVFPRRADKALEQLEGAVQCCQTFVSTSRIAHGSKPRSRAEEYLLAK